MRKTNNLLEQIADFENLCLAFKMCSRGKRQKAGYHNFIFNYGEKLKLMQEELLTTQSFKWGNYREFVICDPKKRVVMAAPFRDRILHTAIHNIINPIVDKTLGAKTYACREGMGNRNAVIRLRKHLEQVKDQRYCIKLDIKQYFANIDHQILKNQLKSILKDDSISGLLDDLIASHPIYHFQGKGIPIGNLTSQLFANLYLSPVDQLACNLLGINYVQDDFEESFYIRYMDDMVIVSKDKNQAFKCVNHLVNFVHEELKLSIPVYKKVILGNAPIPFLGFVLDSNSYRVLARNKRKLTKKIKRMNKREASLSDQAIVLQSYEAWKTL